MGKRKDRAIIFEAADNWHDELVDEIIPDALTSHEERKSYRKQADKLHAALIREQSRLEAKRMRDDTNKVFWSGAQ
jgi:hypothetical protein